MSAIAHVRDEKAADVMYRHLPSWRAVGCYFAWREHYAAQQRSKDGIGRHWNGMVLTEHGWDVPRGPRNPRVLDQIDDAERIVTMRDVEAERTLNAEVDAARQDHELAVLAEDMAIFAWQWTAIIEDDATALDQLHDAQARSEEREAFMVRWHAANRSH